MSETSQNVEILLAERKKQLAGEVAAAISNAPLAKYDNGKIIEPDDDFSTTYRNRLASQISEETDRTVRGKILTEAKQTLSYQLAKGERGAALQGVDYTSTQIQSQQEIHGNARGRMDRHFVSIEASLYKLFPHIRDLSGGVFGVGSDQVLDIFCNSETTTAFIVDFTESVSLFTRTLLEAGIYHKKTFGKFPSREELIDYFEDNNILHIKRIISRNLSDQEAEKVIGLLLGGIEVWFENNTATRVPVTEYMRAKNMLVDDTNQHFSWLGSQEHIDKVLQAYEDGRIYVIKGDLTDPNVLSRVGRIAEQQGVDVSIFYLSNVESYLNGKWDACRNYYQCLQHLPKGRDAVLLRTSWEINSHYPVPHEVADNQLMSQTLHSWHYNA